jgi:hypothetical protein
MSNTETWTDVTRDRVRQVQDNLIATSAWAKESGASESAMQLLLRPYRDLLDSIYERDMSLAKLADNSDLLLHIHGRAASAPSPRVSLLAKLLTETRDQVTRLAMKLEGVAALRVPAALDMGFVGVAPGSLFIGFSADAKEGDSTREAVRAIVEASRMVSEERPVSVLAEAISDPAARDIAIAAVRHLSPSGQLGVSEVGILGKGIDGSTALTTDTRRRARNIMTQRMPLAGRASFVGTVREVDLDASRFELRNVENQDEDVRCAHELEEPLATKLMGQRVRVAGWAELGRRHTVRLLWVDELEVLD